MEEEMDLKEAMKVLDRTASAERGQHIHTALAVVAIATILNAVVKGELK